MLTGDEPCFQWLRIICLKIGELAHPKPKTLLGGPTSERKPGCGESRTARWAARKAPRAAA